MKGTINLLNNNSNTSNSRHRMFHFSIQLENQCCSNSYSSDEQVSLIEKTLSSYGSITKWAYIIHDKDKYSHEEIEKCYATKSNSLEYFQDSEKEKHIIKEKNMKPIHMHVLIYCKSNLDTEYICKWFNIRETDIQFPRGKNAFPNTLLYFTHANNPDKALYEASAIVSNFNHELEIRTIKEKASTNKLNSQALLDFWISKLLDGSYSLYDCQCECPSLFGKNISKLKAVRNHYITSLKPPSSRINIYISGTRKNGSPSGIGKSVACEYIAKELAKTWPELKEADDSKIFCYAGSEKVSFERYDGQPIIIWDDYKAPSLLESSKKRDNLFRIFDIHPKQISQNIKNSSICLINKVNIVCSCQPAELFFDELKDNIGSNDNQNYEDVQIKRRFPILINLYDDKYELKYNRNTNGQVSYSTKMFAGNFAEVMNADATEADKLECLSRLCKPIIDAIKEWFALYDKEIVETSQEVKDRFAHYGEEINESPEDSFEDCEDTTLNLFRVGGADIFLDCLDGNSKTTSVLPCVR